MATVHDLPEIHERLGEAFGVPVRQRGLDPLGELIQAILSQRTSGANSRCAYQQLRERFPTWEAVRDAETDAVAGAIRVAGLARLKAPRIKAVLAQIAEAHGSLDLDFLSAMPAERAMAWLQRLPGVGPTTAACVLLFGAGLPVMPVDGGIHRTVRRLGLAPARATAEHVRALLQHAVPPQWVYPLHVNLIRHGRRICTPVRPRCEVCPLNDRCAYFLAHQAPRPAATYYTGGRPEQP